MSVVVLGISDMKKMIFSHFLVLGKLTLG